MWVCDDVWEERHDYWGARNGDIDNIETVESETRWDNDENSAVRISIDTTTSQTKILFLLSLIYKWSKPDKNCWLNIDLKAFSSPHIHKSTFYRHLPYNLCVTVISLLSQSLSLLPHSTLHSLVEMVRIIDDAWSTRVRFVGLTLTLSIYLLCHKLVIPE